MSLKLGNTDINKGYLGNTEIKKAYLGNDIVFDNTGETAFVATYNIASNGETLQLPVSNLYQIDWGDGQETTTETSHVYSNSGVYTVKMYGVVDDFRFARGGDRSKIRTVENFGGLVIIANSFEGCTILIFNATDTPYRIDNMTKMLDSVATVGHPYNFGQWDLSTNISLDRTFITNRWIVNGIENWDVSNVTNFDFLFRGASDIQSDISGWNTSSAIGMSGTVSVLSGYHLPDTDLSGWDWSNIQRIDRFAEGRTSADFSYQNYDSLLIAWDNQLNVGGMTNLTVDMGTVQYSSAGAAAHANLTAKSLIISDGGQNAF